MTDPATQSEPTEVGGGDPVPGAPGEGVAEPAAAEEDPFAPIPGEPSTFPRDYVEKLRRSGADYRTKLRETEARVAELEPVAEVFSGWEPEQVEGWAQFLGAARDNPEAALASLIRDGFALDRAGASELLDAIFEEAGRTPPGAEPSTTRPGGEDDLDRPMTRREFMAEQARQREAAEQAEMLRQVTDEAKALGYKPDAAAGSQDEYRYHRLLHLAFNTHGNDLGQAHEALVAEEQAAVQAALDRMSSEAENLPALAGNGTPPGVPAGTETDWAKVRSSAAEYLRSATTH